MNTTEHYSDTNFWDKVKNFGQSAGKEVIEKALWLYYTAQDAKTPTWAKTTIYGALAYFILPIDAIPDVIPVAGFTDDLGALAAALATVSAHVTEDIKEETAQKMRQWFN